MSDLRWNDEDYARARDCMIDVLRNRAWTITKGRDEKSFDEAFQHAVGILALTAKSEELATVSKQLERVRGGLRRLIDEINNRDDLPTAEYELFLTDEEGAGK